MGLVKKLIIGGTAVAVAKKVSNKRKEKNDGRRQEPAPYLPDREYYAEEPRTRYHSQPPSPPQQYRQHHHQQQYYSQQQQHYNTPPAYDHSAYQHYQHSPPNSYRSQDWSRRDEKR